MNENRANNWLTVLPSMRPMTRSLVHAEERLVGRSSP
jgi:hypothetical protein